MTTIQSELERVFGRAPLAPVEPAVTIHRGVRSNAAIRMCARKRAYATHALADERVRQMRNAGAPYAELLHAYECDFCNLYHVGNHVASRGDV